MPAFAKLERKVFISQLSIYFLFIFVANLVAARKKLPRHLQQGALYTFHPINVGHDPHE